MSNKIKIFNAIKKELKNFERLFDSYLTDLNYGDYLAQAKGKMLRPALTILAAKINGQVSDSTLWGAVAVELMHNATLVHDDVVDDADKRRDQSTFRAENGDKRAVLYGDYLFAKSLECVIKTGSLATINEIASTTGEMSIGEIQQLNVSGSFSAQEQDYYDIIYKKTASLFICSLMVGYLSSSSNEALDDTVRKIGLNLGMAFQVKDDLLDYDTSGKSGKDFGNDIKERKMTLPLIYALEQASPQEKEPITQLIGLSEISQEQIRTVIDFAIAKGGITYTNKVLQDYIDKANSYIDLLPDGDSKKALKLLGQYLLEREK